MRTIKFSKNISVFVIFASMTFSACQGKPSENSQPTQQPASAVNFTEQLSAANSQIPAQQTDTTYNIAWEFTEHDFGQVQEGGKLAVDFTFTVVEGVAQITGSTTYCGCTVPGWEPKKLNAGESYSIKVEFNTENKMGPFSESVDLFINRSRTPEKITVKGFIVESPNN